MHPSRPGAQPLSARSPRVAVARRLLRRRHRDEAGRFLAEGPQAVREALIPPDLVDELFVTADGAARHTDLVTAAQAGGVSVWPVTEQALAALSETVTPQGLVAVCRHRHEPDLAAVLGSDGPAGRRERAGGSGSLVPRLVAVLAGISDPGNAGTVLRTADAAGAGAVVFGAGSVDPYNGKCVRASAGSLFHVRLVRGTDISDAVARLRAAGLRVLAADASGEADLDDLADDATLTAPTAWLFGSEAHGLADDVAALADARVRVPIHGRAESLNLAAAAAVCLYASARAHRQSGAPA
jgi:TrmH family RNA methyltransferase